MSTQKKKNIRRVTNIFLAVPRGAYSRVIARANLTERRGYYHDISAGTPTISIYKRLKGSWYIQGTRQRQGVVGIIEAMLRAGWAWMVSVQVKGLCKGRRVGLLEDVDLWGKEWFSGGRLGRWPAGVGVVAWTRDQIWSWSDCVHGLNLDWICELNL